MLLLALIRYLILVIHRWICSFWIILNQFESFWIILNQFCLRWLKLQKSDSLPSCDVSLIVVWFFYWFFDYMSNHLYRNRDSFRHLSSARYCKCFAVVDVAIQFVMLSQYGRGWSVIMHMYSSNSPYSEYEYNDDEFPSRKAFLWCGRRDVLNYSTLFRGQMCQGTTQNHAHVCCNSRPTRKVLILNEL